MRIDRIQIRGFTTYRETQDLALAALGPGLVAVAGANGSGKTTLLEAIPGAIYRTTPSRGNIAALATARDARIEVVGVNGAPFTIRLDVDAHTGKQEAVLLDGVGDPVAGPKVRDFDRAIADRFPPLEVYLAAAFASQTGAGSVLRMSRAERRALFGRLLGLERLEQMAQAARERARAAEANLTAARAALEAVRAGAGDVAALAAALVVARGEAARAAGAQRNAADKLRAALVERDRKTADLAEAQRTERAAEDARRRFERLAEQAAEAEARLADLAAVLADAPAIRAHAERIADAEAETDRLRAEGESAAETERVALREEAAAAEAFRAAQQAEAEAIRAMAKLQEDLQRARDGCARAEAACAGVPCAGMLSDERRATCPALLGHFETVRRTQAEIERLGDGASLERACASARDLLAEAGREHDAARAEAAAKRAAADDLRRRWKAAHAALADLRSRDRSEALVRAEAAAASARTMLSSLQEQMTAAREEADRLRAAVPAVDMAAVGAAEAAVASASEAASAADAAASAASRQVAVLETQLDAARAAQEKAEQLVASVAPLERDLADWRFLARGLGREGVQALELDAAGPRVSALANELLAEAYGPRFRLRFETQAAKADGKGVKETFDIVVCDNERGREGNGEDLSGGEKVIVGEALGLAVGLFHAQAAGVALGTVIRDETVGALDPENAERYLAMLRAFLRVGRVHQLLFVAHSPQIVEMADVRVRVHDGRIEVGG